MSSIYAVYFQVMFSSAFLVIIPVIIKLHPLHIHNPSKKNQTVPIFISKNLNNLWRLLRSRTSGVNMFPIPISLHICLKRCRINAHVLLLMHSVCENLSTGALDIYRNIITEFNFWTRTDLTRGELILRKEERSLCN